LAKTSPSFKDTEILGCENVYKKRNIDKLVNLDNKPGKSIDIVVDNKDFLPFFETNNLCKSLISRKTKETKIRIITKFVPAEIGKKNKVFSLADEVRISNNLQGSFIMTESLSMIFVNADNYSNNKIPSMVIFDNPIVVQQQQFLFDILWEKSYGKSYGDHESKIKRATEVITDNSEIKKRIIDLMKMSNEICVCSTVEGLKLIKNDFFNFHEELLEKYQKGKYKGTRWITSINSKDDVKVVKDLLSESMCVRHIRDISTLTANFAFDDNVFYSTIDTMKGGKMITSLMSSSDTLYIETYRSIFERLWMNGQDAMDRIYDIENGLQENDISVLYNPEEVVNLGRKYFESAKKEVLMILPSFNSSLRIERNSDFVLFDDLAKRGIKVKVLIPILPRFRERINHLMLRYPLIEFKILSFTLPFLMSTAIIDREKLMSSEIIDDTKNSYNEAIRLGVFIDSRHTALSYASIFENLWAQTEIDELLRINDRIQQDFLHIAAHELRTPIQSLMGYTTILQKELEYSTEYKDYFDAVKRNIDRINKLTDRLLDVTQFETNKFVLRKETFDFSKMMLELLKEYKIKIKETENILIDIRFLPKYSKLKEPLMVFADKIKIIQVMMNLLDNAIEFSKYNEIRRTRKKIRITVVVENSIRKSRDNKTQNELTISIIDNGPGIPPEILPRVFSKFVTTSANGIGLGLYFSKKIIEAHEGQISAKNRDDNKGAIFSINIPV
jgi:signal transduction histidine kinase